MSKSNSKIYLGIIIAVLVLSASIAKAATTISTDISTGGNISALGSVGIGTTSPFTTLGVGVAKTNYINDGFEDNTLPPFTTSGNANWTIQGSTVFAGTKAAQAGAPGDEGRSVLTLAVTLTNPASLSFYYKVSSEENYDGLEFAIGGQIKNVFTGDVNWTKYSTYLPAGTYNLTWAYIKDTGGGFGSDTAWIDNVVIDYDTTQTLLSGQVGIGSMLPGTALNVDGDINFSGVVKMNNAPVMNFMTDNLFVGTRQKTSGFTGSGNAFFGPSVANGLDFGYYNSVFGVGAAYNLGNGSWNTVMGNQAMYTNSSGIHNTIIGNASGYYAGSYNTTLGSYALFTTTGDHSIGLGYAAGASADGSYELFIDSVGRNSDTEERTRSIIYGNMATLPTSQTLTVNAALNVNRGANATSTVTVGTAGQNKGSCLELYDTSGTVRYAYVAAGSNTFTLSSVSCK